VGEIRVKVRLTNALDEALAHRGELNADQIRSLEADAMIDTGAIRSVIPADILDKLGVQIRGQRRIQMANGQWEDVGVSEPLLFQIEDREAAEEALVLGDEVLIGQTTLEAVDLLADCARQVLVPGHPDGPVLKVKLVAC
jgi:predicted aspartyl protease